MRRFLPIALLAAAAPLPAQNAGPFVIEQTGVAYPTLDAAVTAAQTGEPLTILIAPGVYRECTVQTGGRITFRARTPGSVIFDGAACEGKATFVLRGEQSTVDGITFRRIRVPDGNGAGIRTELGNLTVTNSSFLDSQEGILGGDPNGQQRIVIDRSTFAGLGQCDETADCSHSVYMGNNGSITITRSRFERGTGGHYVKIRSPRVEITDNSFDDSRGSKTNYMIDLAEGGTGVIARNTFVQGRGKENWTGLIVVGAEKRTFPAAGLRIEGNDARLAPGMDKSPAFVADYSGEGVVVGANRLGPGLRRFEKR
ncbi:right-handed parallel beta-helix repeat-containing protein [Sphingomonas sp. VNH70]|uniref:right-handed parallel beta-helix repeat-containing protein n=1 Tax=Sphingomonas silueang TaxID=3156617 RepID=UPI0032B55182